MTDEMNLDELHRALSTALPLQARATLYYTLVAGTLTGRSAVAVADRLAEFAAAELYDTRRLVEKSQALGYRPDLAVEALPHAENVDHALRGLVDSEEAALVALHGVIPHTGQEPASEALEHLLEHLILRKQGQVDYLRRALGPDSSGS